MNKLIKKIRLFEINLMYILVTLVLLYLYKELFLFHKYLIYLCGTIRTCGFTNTAASPFFPAGAKIPQPIHLQKYLLYPYRNEFLGVHLKCKMNYYKFKILIYWQCRPA